MARKKKLGVVTCPKCGYTWVTGGERAYATCPNCFYCRVPNPYAKFPEVRRSERAIKATA